MTYYSYFKRFSTFSIGGTITGVERKTARYLLTRLKGQLDTDIYSREKGVRRFNLSNRGVLTIYIGKY